MPGGFSNDLRAFEHRNEPWWLHGAPTMPEIGLRGGGGGEKKLDTACV